MCKKSMHQLGFKHKTDKAKKHRYTLAFPLYMECYRQSSLTFLEVGIKEGASLRMWDEYFEHEDATLVAIDIAASTMDNVPKTDRWHGYCGSQRDQEFLAEVGQEHGPFDVIVEDGCHEPEYQLDAFEGLWPFISRGGIYVIEDMHKNFLKETVLSERLHTMVERLVISGKRRRTVSYDFLHFYRNMVVIGKKMRA